MFVEQIEGNMSFIQFSKLFGDEFACTEYLKSIRWKDGGVTCPFCGSDKICFFSDGQRRKCKVCFKKFSLTTGTLFHHTKSPLTHWFYLIFLMSSSKKNISSIQVSKNLGITQKSAWGMMNKIRDVFKEDYLVKLNGVVEVDESFVSKGNNWTRWGGISTRKEPILGLMQRGGRVVVRMIEDRKRETIEKIIKEHVEPNTVIFTDGHLSYKNLSEYYWHEFVEHSTREYVRGNVHTNTIENFWSFLKKNIRLAHHSVSAKHIQQYCDEIAYRFNYRDLGEMDKFNDILSRAVINKNNSINILPMNELPFGSLEFKKIWDEWIKYRKEQKFPTYKPIGLKRTLTELFNDSGGDEQIAIKMIINAMKNTWRGIFKININGTNKTGTSAARIETARKW